MNIEIKPAKATKKEFAEAPFTINALIGSQFTIEEKLGMSECPRIKVIPTKDGKKTYNVIALKVSNGMFEKDLHIFDTEWKIMCTALPDSLVSLQGVTLKPTRDPNNPLRVKFEYIGVARQDMSGNGYNNSNNASEKIAASMEEAPTEIGGQIRALHAAMQTNQATKITNSFKVVLDIAEKTRPGDALALITEAKKQGWITERVVDGVTTYRAE